MKNTQIECTKILQYTSENMSVSMTGCAWPSMKLPRGGPRGGDTQPSFALPALDIASSV